MSCWCPRCGSTRVSGHGRTGPPDYFCGACFLIEPVSDRWGEWDGESYPDYTWPADRVPAHVRSRPSPLRNEALLAQVLAEPDNDDARAVYADWCHEQPSPHGRAACEFIHGQLALARAWRTDPTANPERILERYRHVFGTGEAWWRSPCEGVADELAAALRPFSEPELIADLWFVRGFVEHVAIRAERFLSIGDRLCTITPLRHLTLIDCGHRFDDELRLDRVVESPAFANIRSLQLPGRRLDEPKLLLNELDTKALVRIAPHLEHLVYVEVRDQWQVERTVLEHLPVRAARWALHHYPRTGSPTVIEEHSIGEPHPLRRFFGT